jgi:endonuclease/exonuclease/phosphatase family metal-dependent hydrolase
MRSDNQRLYIGAVPQLWMASANLNGFVKYHWHERENLCAHVLKFMPAQLIGFQEFSNACIAPLQGARPDLIFELSERMGNIRNAIAYDAGRFELFSCETIPLSPTGIMEKAWDGGIRSFMITELYDRVFKANIVFVNMHLDHVSCLARKKSIEIILKKLRGMPQNTPIIVVGDANVNVGSPHERWKMPDMRAPYDMMTKEGFMDCVLHGNPQRPIRENTYHKFRGAKYDVDHDDYFGTWDPDWNFVSQHWQTIDSVRILDTWGGLNYSDHYFLQSLIRLKQ